MPSIADDASSQRNIEQPWVSLRAPDALPRTTSTRQALEVGLLEPGQFDGQLQAGQRLRCDADLLADLVGVISRVDR